MNPFDAIYTAADRAAQAAVARLDDGTFGVMLWTRADDRHELLAAIDPADHGGPAHARAIARGVAHLAISEHDR